MTEPNLPSLVVNQDAGPLSKGNQQKVEVTVQVPPAHSTIQAPTIPISFEPLRIRQAVELCHATFLSAEDREDAADFTSIALDDKHKLNNFCAIFWDEVISEQFELAFFQFEQFLHESVNQDLRKMLIEIGAGLNRQIESKRHQSQYANVQYQAILQDIGNELLKNQYDKLQPIQDAVDFVLYYLYSQCLVGRKTPKERANVNP